MRSTGWNNKLSVDRLYEDLPVPRHPKKVAELEAKNADFHTDPNHGLYGFFNKVDGKYRTVMPTEEEQQFGRAWAVHELTFKSFEDLHVLYWKCIMEGNRARTRSVEHARIRPGYGIKNIQDRVKCVSCPLKPVPFQSIL